MNKFFVVFSLSLFTAVSVAASAATAASVTSVDQCRSIKANAKRLQCYDNMPTDGVSTSTASTPDERSASVGWVNEPEAFLNIKLDQSIETSIPTACPSRTLNSFESFDEFKWGQQGKPRCYFDRPTTKPHWGEFKGHGVEAFRQEQVFLYQGTLAGKTIVRFFSSKYPDILESLIQKYGKPTNTTKSIFRMNNGGELPNEISTWMGKKAILSIVALEKRDTSGGLIDYGSVTWASVNYINESLDLNEKQNRDRSEKF
jgi:hypothetical protein